jgi:hypothetical protein
MSVRTKVLQSSRITRCCSTLLVLLGVLTFLSSATVAKSQTRTSNLPGPGIREGNRAMDDYDRAINRMKNDAKAVNERRRNLFPQINEDFQRIQVIHNEIVRMLQPEKALNYDRLAELTDDMKKRTARLRSNLVLPEPEKTAAERTHPDAIDDTHMKKTIVDLHDLIVSFVANPIFKNLGVVDSKVIAAASENLDSIMDISDEIKREARILGKSKK